MKHRSLFKPVVFVVVLVATIAAVSAVGVALTAKSDGPSFGAVPEEVAHADSIEEELALVPDFVQAVGRHGEDVGYIPKDALYAPDGRGNYAPIDGPLPVVAADGETLVGHIFPDKGFVGIDENPDNIPDVNVEMVEE